MSKRLNNQFHSEVVGRRLVEDNTDNIRFLSHPVDVSLYTVGSEIKSAETPNNKLLSNDRISDFNEIHPESSYDFKNHHNIISSVNANQQSEHSSSTVSNKYAADISSLSKLSSKNTSLATVHDINNTIESLKRTRDELRQGTAALRTSHDQRSSSAMRPTQISSIDSKSRVASTNTAAQATSLLQSSTASNSAYFSRLGSNVSVSKQSVDSAVSRSKTPTRQNDVIEARSKRAAEWLHNEKKQVDLRRQEREKNRELVKSIDTQRRALSQIETNQKVRNQIDMLNADLHQHPLRHITSKPNPQPPSDSDANQNYRVSSDKIGPNQKEDLDIVLTRESLTMIRVSKEDLRASSDALIGQIADRFSDRKRLTRPMVPRLSKSYVNEKTVFDSRFRYTSDSYAKTSKNSSTKAGKENDSDDFYFDTDEKAEAEKEVVEHDNKINANAALMLRLSLRSNKSAPQHDDDDDDLADDNDRTTKKDLITALAEKEKLERREKGKQYLEKQKEIYAKKEEEDKKSSTQQLLLQRRKALQDLNIQVLNKNRRSYINKLKRNSEDVNKMEKVSAANVRPMQSKYSVLTGDIMTSIQPSEVALGTKTAADEINAYLWPPTSVYATVEKEITPRETFPQMSTSLADEKDETIEPAVTWGMRRPSAVGRDDLLVVECDAGESSIVAPLETAIRINRNDNILPTPSEVDRGNNEQTNQVPSIHQPLLVVTGQEQPSGSIAKEPPFTVAIQAKRNFEKVRKVLSDVDRMCSMLHTQTVELEEKLKVRDSVDSFKVDSYKAEHLLVEPYKVAPSRVEASNVDVNDIRTSISEKLYSKVFALFRVDPDPSNGSSLESKSSSADDLIAANDLDAVYSKTQPISVSHSSYAKNNDSSREDEDSVLMGDYDDRNEDIYGQTPAPFPGTMLDPNTSNDQKRAIVNSNVSSQTASYVPIPFPVGDPFLIQHLGILADKRDILGKFSDYIDEYKNDYYSEDEQPRLLNEAGRNVGDRVSYETWNLPAKNMQTNQRKPMAAYAGEQFPSLRNVGELAGLLRTDFEAKVEQMATFGDERNFAGRHNEAAESLDEFSVVTLFAKEYFKRFAAPPLPPQDRPIADDGWVDIPNTGDIAVEDLGNDTPYIEASEQYSEYEEEENNLRREDENSDQRELQDSQTFWNSLLNRPLRSEVTDPTENSSHRTTYDNEQVLYDLQMNARQQEIQRLEADASKNSNTSPTSMEAKPAIKYSAAELRARMVEELRRQDDIFNYTLELAEIQQANSLQAARDLAIQSNTRTEIEIMELQKRKELELQQLAYENSIAISVANAHLVSEQQNAEQRILVERLHAELEKNQLQQDYNSLLHQASQMSADYETNERLLALDRAINEDKRSIMQQEFESKRIISATMASAYAAEAVAKAAVQFRQPTIILRNSEQQTELPTTISVGEKRDGNSISKKSLDDSIHNDDYSVSFDQESLMASDRRTPKGMKIVNDGRNNHSFLEENSVETDEDDEAEQSILESIATQKISLDRQRPSTVDVDNSYSLQDEISHDSYGDEINEESIQESNISRNKSAMDHSIRSLESGPNVSHSVLSEKTTREKNIQKALQKNQSYQSGVSRTISNSSTASYENDDFESSAISGQSVEEDIREESNDSIQEASVVSGSGILSQRPATDPPESEYSSYSDTFASKSISSASGKSIVDDTIPSQSYSQSIAETQTSQSRSIQPQELPTAKNLLTYGSDTNENKSLISIQNTQTDLDHALALFGEDDVNNQSVSFDERMIQETLELYKKDMEARLRGQERTYSLRLRFIKAKKQHRLNLVSSSSQDEQQKVVDEYEEEKAQLERERWTMNANAYKELRKFKQLQKELLAYNLSLKNSDKSNSEERAKKLADMLAPELSESDSLSSTGSIQDRTFSKNIPKKLIVGKEKFLVKVDTITASSRLPPQLIQEKTDIPKRSSAVEEEVEEYDEDVEDVSLSGREKSVALRFSSAGDESYVNEDFDDYMSSRNSTAMKPKHASSKQELSDSTESIKSDALTDNLDDKSETNDPMEVESSVKNSFGDGRLLASSVTDNIIKDSSASVARSLVVDTDQSVEYSMAYDSHSHIQNSLEQNENASKNDLLDSFIEEEDSVVQTESSESSTEDKIANDKQIETIESKDDISKSVPLREFVTASDDHQDIYGSTADYSLDYEGDNSVSRASININNKSENVPAIAVTATTAKDNTQQDIPDEISEEIEEEEEDDVGTGWDGNKLNNSTSDRSHESQQNLEKEIVPDNQDLKDSYLDDDDFEDDFEVEGEISSGPVNQNTLLTIVENDALGLKPKLVEMDDDTFEEEIPEESIVSSEDRSDRSEDVEGDDSISREQQSSAVKSKNDEKLLERKRESKSNQQVDVMQLQPTPSVQPLPVLTETSAATTAARDALLMDDEIASVMSEVLEEPDAVFDDGFASNSFSSTPQKQMQKPFEYSAGRVSKDDYEIAVEHSVDQPVVKEDVVAPKKIEDDDNEDDADYDNVYEDEFEEDFNDENESTPAELTTNHSDKVAHIPGSSEINAYDDESVATSVPESIEGEVTSQKSDSTHKNDESIAVFASHEEYNESPHLKKEVAEKDNDLDEVAREYELDLSDVPDPEYVVSASSISKLQAVACSGKMTFDSDQQKWVGDDVSMDGFSDSENDFHDKDILLALPSAPKDITVPASQQLNLSSLAEYSDPHSKNLEINISVLSEVSDFDLQPSGKHGRDQFSVLDEEELDESEDKTVQWVKPLPQAVKEKVDIPINDFDGDDKDVDEEFSSDTVEGRLTDVVDLANPNIKILDLNVSTMNEPKVVHTAKVKRENEIQTVDDITSVIFDRMLRDILGTMDASASIPASDVSKSGDVDEDDLSSDTVEGSLNNGVVAYDMLIEIPNRDDTVGKTIGLQETSAEKKTSLSSLSNLPSPLITAKSKPTLKELADLDDLYEFDISAQSNYAVPNISPILVQTEPVEVSTMGIQDEENLVDNNEKRSDDTSQIWEKIVEDTQAQLAEIFEAIAIDSIKERLLNPDFKGSFIDEEEAKVVSDHFQSSSQSSSLSCELLLDRINEICTEIHSMRYGIDGQSGGEITGGGSRPAALSKRLLAQHLPLEKSSHLCEYITSRIASEQQSLVQLLRGEKAMHDHMLNVRTVDELQEEVATALQAACSEVADGILAKLLIQTTASCMNEMNLSEEQIQTLIQLSTSS